MSEWQAYANDIKALSTLEFNYDPEIFHATADKLGWNVDKYEASVGSEPPGSPASGGTFERLKEMITFYKFPDPKLISAVFDPSSPLKGRNMLLQARFLGLRFSFGVRIVDVIDEVREGIGGGRETVWGYSYRTLKGHFEMGEIRFELAKNQTTGEIIFRINAYSRADYIHNLFYRIGFRIFGRSLQRYFASSSIKRVRAYARSDMH